MAESIVERVAIAIGGDWLTQTFGDLRADWWSTQPADQKDQWRQVARAAIAAMREPTDDMLAIGEGYMDFYLPDACGPNTPEGRRSEFKIGYQMAIDVALGTDPVARAAARIAARQRRERPTFEQPRRR